MNKRIKRDWLKALRGKLLDANGNKYEQCQNVLHNRRGQYCCLGVLTDLEFEGDWVYDHTYKAHVLCDQNGNRYGSAVLPTDIQAKAKISNHHHTTLTQTIVTGKHA